jgi:hypothetical protein
MFPDAEVILVTGDKAIRQSTIAAVSVVALVAEFVSYWHALPDWVETVFRAQYPDCLSDQIRPCWPNLPEAGWEMAWLYQQWSVAYPAKRPMPQTGRTAGPLGA